VIDGMTDDASTFSSRKTRTSTGFQQISDLHIRVLLAYLTGSLRVKYGNASGFIVVKGITLM
jgi:hypothetical protein